MKAICASLCVAIGIFAGPIAALTFAEPARSDIALVIAPPWVAHDELIEAADGKIIGPTSAYFGVLATSEQADFVETVKSKGAWFVLDGERMAAICGIKT